MPYTSLHQMNRGLGFYKISLVVFLILFFCPPLAAQPGCERELLSTGLIQTITIPQLPFIPNKGQVNDRVAFYAKSSYGTRPLTKEGEIVYALARRPGDGDGAAVQTPNKADVASDIAYQSGITRNPDFRPSQAGRTEAMLVIGPLVASTYIGGKSADVIFSLATDASGNVYAAGHTRSLDIPTTTDAYDTSYNGGSDAFIVKLNATMTNIIACTYLGGSADDSLQSMAVDAEGNVYVAGYTWSTDFPTSVGALCRTFRGGNIDAFVSRFDAALSTLIASTYLGGSSEDYGYSLALDAGGNLYLAGRTLSANFPTTGGAYDVSRRGYGDVFTSKINGYLSNIIASTLLGGSSDDVARCVTVDAQGSVYVAGETASPDFPVTGGSYNTSHNGEVDGFVSKLKGDLTGLLASTFLGGSSEDGISAMLKHPDGGVYVSGRTASADFPTTVRAYHTVHGGGGYDAFVSKLSSDLASLPASTFLGGVSLDRCHAITADAQGDICVAGETASSNFPTTQDACDISYNGGDCDAFLSKFNSTLTDLLSSTFLGGSGYDYASCITTDKDGYLCVAGYTKSPDFPVTANASNTVYKSDEAFLSKVLSKAASTPHGKKVKHNH